jgi:transposase
VKRPGRPGRPRRRPAALVGDKGYASRKARDTIRHRGIRPVIPSKTDERAQPGFDKQLYRERNQIERLVNRLKRWRKIATRYEKRALYFAAFLTLAFIREWLHV